jgi:hypothetical protein
MNSHVGGASRTHQNSVLNVMLVDNLDGIMHYIFSGQPIGESRGCITLHNFLDAFYETMHHMNMIIVYPQDSACTGGTEQL